jgi:hypothetical protein
MKHRHIAYNYEIELMRRDCPKDGVGEWLNNQAIILHYRETNQRWSIDKTRLQKHEDGTHTYFIRLTP